MRFLILLALIILIVNIARSLTKVGKAVNNAGKFRGESKEKDITHTSVIIEDSTEKKNS